MAKMFAAKQHSIFIYPGRFKNVKLNPKGKITKAHEFQKGGWI
jgi:hypothetical protein